MVYLVTNSVYLLSSGSFEMVSLQEAIKLLEPLGELGLDTETKGLDCHTKDLLLLQLGNSKIQVVFDIASYGGIIPQHLKNFLMSKRFFILQNAKFDLKFLFKQGIVLTNVYDTMLAEIILTNGLQYSGRDLDSLSQKYCGEGLDKSIRGDIIKKNLNEAILFYAAKDVQNLDIIKRKQLSAAKDLDLLKAIDLDNAFVVVLAYTEYCGIKLDYNKWASKTLNNIEEVKILKDTLEKYLWDDGKFEYFNGMYSLFEEKQDCIINWDSPKQVITLFKSYGINTTLKIKGETKETIDAKVLEPQRKKFPILGPYLDYKEKQKEVSTYGYKWKNYINPVTGRIHTTFQQLMNTGRLSSGNKYDGTPNLQNLPKDALTRSCFIPEIGCLMVDADYSSQEQIVLANFSKEPNLINFYKKGFNDMHSYVAFLMYENIRKCSIEELTPSSLDYIKEEHPDKRYLAKIAGFSINYGGNGATIAKNCNIPRKDGDFVYNSYFEAFPEMKKYFELVFKRASYFGYVQFNNVTKRKYFFDLNHNDYFTLKETVEDSFEMRAVSNPFELRNKYNSAKSEIARIAQNYPIQGSSGDITKYAGILFFKEILSRNWLHVVKIVNFVHDEILVECPEYMVDEVKQVLLNCMENAGKPFCPIVPLKADALVGDHWIH